MDLEIRLKWLGALLVGEDPIGMWRSLGGCRVQTVKGKDLSSAKGEGHVSVRGC